MVRIPVSTIYAVIPAPAVLSKIYPVSPAAACDIRLSPAGAAGADGKSLLRNIPSTNVITTLDATSGTALAGVYPTATIGSDGLGLLAYFYCGDFDTDTEACSG